MTLAPGRREGVLRTGGGTARLLCGPAISWASMEVLLAVQPGRTRPTWDSYVVGTGVSLVLDPSWLVQLRGLMLAMLAFEATSTAERNRHRLGAALAPPIKQV